MRELFGETAVHTQKNDLWRSSRVPRTSETNFAAIISAQLTCCFTLWILQIVREQRRGSVIDVFNGCSVGE